MLVTEALKCSTDNVTCAVVYFKWDRAMRPPSRVFIRPSCSSPEKTHEPEQPGAGKKPTTCREPPSEVPTTHIDATPPKSPPEEEANRPLSQSLEQGNLHAPGLGISPPHPGEIEPSPPQLSGKNSLQYVSPSSEVKAYILLPPILNNLFLVQPTGVNGCELG